MSSYFVNENKSPLAQHLLDGFRLQLLFSINDLYLLLILQIFFKLLALIGLEKWFFQQNLVEQLILLGIKNNSNCPRSFSRFGFTRSFRVPDVFNMLEGLYVLWNLLVNPFGQTIYVRGFKINEPMAEFGVTGAAWRLNLNLNLIWDALLAYFKIQISILWLISFLLYRATWWSGQVRHRWRRFEIITEGNNVVNNYPTVVSSGKNAINIAIVYARHILESCTGFGVQ
jgi:hypothetical protein